MGTALSADWMRPFALMLTVMVCGYEVNGRREQLQDRRSFDFAVLHSG